MKSSMLKRIVKKLLVVLWITLFIGCNQHIPNEENLSENEKNALGYYNFSKRDNNDIKDNLNLSKNLKLIKSAEARYKVKNVEKSTLRIKSYIKQNGGYISNLQFINNTYELENKFTIKVPQEKFDSILDSINTSVEFIDYERISTRDVTEEHVDLTSRLNTKLEVKTRYEEILRKKAKTVKEILETEEKLGTLQEEIEAAQGKLNYLNNRVSYSTIQIELYETVDYKESPITYQKSFWSKSKEGLFNGWNIISVFALAIINIWPLIVFGMITLLIIRRRKLFKAKNKKN